MMFIPWIDRLNRQQQSVDIDKIKQRIQSGKHSSFISIDVIDKCGHVSFYFIGEYQNKPCVYHGLMSTTRGDFLDKCQNQAFDIVYKEIPSIGDIFDNFKLNDDGSSTYIDPDPELTTKRFKRQAELTLDIINNDDVMIESVDIKIDEKHEGGIGIDIRLPLDYITIDDVERFIIDFTQYNYNCIDLVNSIETRQYFSNTAEELGIELSPCQRFIVWNDGWLHNDNAVDLDEYRDEL